MLPKFDKLDEDSKGFPNFENARSNVIAVTNATGLIGASARLAENAITAAEGQVCPVAWDALSASNELLGKAKALAEAKK